MEQGDFKLEICNRVQPAFLTIVGSDHPVYFRLILVIIFIQPFEASFS